MIVTKRTLLTMIQEAVLQAVEEAKFDPVILTQRNLDFDDAITFVREKAKLRFLGEGSSRIVFALDSKKVLKLAIDVRGVAQNKAEVETFQSSPNGLVASIFRFDPAYQWVISELVRPLNDANEFQQLTGISWGIFRRLVGENHEDWKGNIPDILRRVGQKNTSPHMVYNNPFTKNAMNSLARLPTPLLGADLNRIEHWGKTPDQRVVLLDYGYTQQVSDDHYSW